MYYGVDENGPLKEDNPLDIDKAGFQPQVFMEKVLKESSLNQLYRQEEKMKKGKEWLLTDRQRLTPTTFPVQRFKSWTATCNILCTRTTQSSSKLQRPSERYSH